MDIVICVPRSMTYRGQRGLAAWMAEGDAPGTSWSGKEWHYSTGAYPRLIMPGERVYAVYNNILIGYAPLVRIDTTGSGYALVRHGDAVALTISRKIPSFRGFRYRRTSWQHFWERFEEIPFPNWQYLLEDESNNQ